MDNKEPLISIIVPVYNASAYLEECIQSILCQTYKKIEVICVNDGSTDESLNILRRFQEADGRLIIINKDNAGVSAARNDGIARSSGEYLMFVDSDDWIEINTCEQIIENNTIDADILMWSYISEGTSGSRKKVLFESNCEFTSSEIKEKLHRRCIGLVGEELRHPELMDSLSTVWGKLYRRSLVMSDNIQFVDLREIGTYEDGLFNLSTFESAKSVVYVNQHLYHYRREKRNSITSGYRSQLLKQWMRLFSFMEKYIADRELDETYREALNNRIALSTLGLTLNVLSSNFSLIEKNRMVKQYMQSERFALAYSKLKISYFPFHWKIFYALCRHHCSMAVLLLCMMINKLING